ncbi:MAG: hypothetical protein HC908_04700 [Calothrix sp. SM1_7_51]|nr:hypothetical protein [Calothrix sp. SM1_7_51]
MWERLLLAAILTFSTSVFVKVTEASINKTDGEVYRPSEPILILTRYLSQGK